MLYKIKYYERQSKCNCKCPQHAMFDVKGVTQHIKLCRNHALELVQQLCNDYGYIRRGIKTIIEEKGME